MKFTSVFRWAICTIRAIEDSENKKENFEWLLRAKGAAVKERSATSEYSGILVNDVRVTEAGSMITQNYLRETEQACV